MSEIEHVTPKEAFLKEFQKNFNEKFLPAEWSEEKKVAVQRHTTSGKIKTNLLTSIPMICRGDDCTFADTCPLQKEGIAPVGLSCSLELALVGHAMADYVDSLNIDPDDFVEYSQIRDLVDLEVQQWRKTRLLAKEDFIQEYCVGVDGSGDPVMGKQLHLGIAYEAHILKQKQLIFKQLLATREAKAKAGFQALDSTQTMSNLMDSMRSIQHKREQALKQELGIIDKDDFVDDAEIIEDDYMTVEVDDE